MATIVTLTNPELYTATDARQICGVTDELAGRNGPHAGYPIHLASECGLLAGLIPYSEDVRCSVCDQRIDTRFGFGQHERCAWLGRNGERTYAQPVVTFRTADGEIEIRTAELF